MSRSAALTLCVLSLLHLTAGLAVASNWPFLTEPNTLISDATAKQQNVRAIPDGTGGAIMVWQDLRNQLDWNVYAQRVNGNGDVLWTVDGVPVSNDVFNQETPEIASDGAGGAIIVWVDIRNGDEDIYAQRIDADGNALWAANGVPVSSAFLFQRSPAIIADGANGAIIAWEDARTAVTIDIFAQRIDANGNPVWTVDGELVSQGNNDQTNPQLASDGAFGAVVVWEDFRSGVDLDIYAQRMEFDGNAMWTANGVVVDAAAADQLKPQVVSTIANGALVSWWDFGIGQDIFAVRVLADGTQPGGPNVVTAGLGNFFDHVMTSDGQNGSIIAFLRDESGDNTPSVQRTDLNGNPIWNGGLPVNFTNGVPNASATGLNVTSDGAGGALMTWLDASLQTGDDDVFVIRLDSFGNIGWNPIAVSTAVGDQIGPQIVHDGFGGGVLVWDDERDGIPDLDIYAQRFELNGYLGYPSADITSVEDSPNDQGGVAIVTWDASYLDAFPNDLIDNYSVWRRNDGPLAAAIFSAARATANINAARATPSIDAALAAGIDRELALAQAAAGWEFYGIVAPTYLSSYAMSVDTYGDSTLTSFQIITDATLPITYWMSAAVSGFSLDNLAPAPPLLTGATVVTDAQLTWQDGNPPAPDIAQYAVYRNAAPGATPTPGDFLAYSPIKEYLDTTTGGVTHYYIVTAIDIHDNEGPESNEVAVPNVATGIGDTPSIVSRFAVLPNSPNPFGDATTIRVGLPDPSSFVVEVFDVAGRRVFVDRVAERPAGWHDYQLLARDSRGRAMPSGVYFYRVTAGANTQTRKLAIMR